MYQAKLYLNDHLKENNKNNSTGDSIIEKKKKKTIQIFLLKSVAFSEIKKK